MERLHARLEANLLPHVPIEHPSLQVRTLYRPGESRLGLGGDFFDFLPLDGTGAAFIIGDVSGHGVDAASLGAVLRSTWRALALAGNPLPDTLGFMHDVLCWERSDPNLFATVLAGTVASTGAEATFAGAGHLPPILLAENARELALPPELPLGCWKRHWDSTTIALPPRWTLFLYTDGLMEGRAVPGGSERFGFDRLLRTLDRHGVADATGSGLEDLLSEVRAANGAELADDVAALVISGTVR